MGGDSAGRSAFAKGGFAAFVLCVGGRAGGRVGVSAFGTVGSEVLGAAHWRCAGVSAVASVLVNRGSVVVLVGVGGCAGG